MKRAFLLIMVVIMGVVSVKAQNNITGALADSISGERLAFVNVGLILSL